MRTLIIGITGQFCSGKSTVAKALTTCGVKVIDVDLLAKKNLSSFVIKNKIRAAFGRHIFLKTGNISKEKLAKSAFLNKKTLKQLNSAVRPLLCKQLEKAIKHYSATKHVIALDMAILLDTPFYKKCDHIIGVVAPRSFQVKRAIKRGFSKYDFLRRIRLQPSQEEIKHRCDYVVINDRTQTELKKTVKQILEDIKHEKRRKRKEK